ncbi:Deoxyribonuclease-2-alpha [Acipenser ruthenus]|uniref:deoxyribonuclease II n=1 Tax=Acipenser ruthenus TaxID=7906 RepID=A0A444UX35_ACIRT|nr:Deoxyribonuclease-2-alpha [Acipenser ruthenus]
MKYLLYLLFLSSLLDGAVAAVSCYNDNGEPVDWFFLYKLPRPRQRPLEDGLRYMYLDSENQDWREGRGSINQSEGAVGRTLEQLYKLGEASLRLVRMLSFIPVSGDHVFFSSMTSLQTEEFFEMVANSQGRRLDNQRAELQEPPPPSAPACENEATVEGAGSEEAPNLGVTEGGAEKKAANEELYSMILSYQVQGRIDEQRSRPPGPVDDEGFFSLLLRVQGGRMEEQRVELPEGLLRRVNSH